jgi:hypothetical protein
MLVYSQLKVASLENLSADPILLPLGRVFFDTVLDRPKIKISSGVKQLLFKDDPVIIGTNGTASTNVKLFRSGVGIAQAVLASDATAEGTSAVNLAQVGIRHESFTDAGKPAAGNAGRIIWLTDVLKLQYDTGSVWTDVGSLANPMTTGGDLIYGGSGGTATRLANGTAGQFLSSRGTTLAPVWESFVTPTVQRFTSGSGTYTTPANVKYIKVRLVGGGGGGGGSGTASYTNGVAGGSTTFGTSLLTATAGAGGAIGGGAAADGGSFTVNSPAVNISSVDGGRGGGTLFLGATGDIRSFGGFGAPSNFGGSGGAASWGGAGAAAKANSGSGGSGGACSGGYAPNFYTGGGGGAGAYIEAIINAPSATYSYAVGAAGTAGSAGTSGFAGGAGGAGILIVEEYYQ